MKDFIAPVLARAVSLMVLSLLMSFSAISQPGLSLNLAQADARFLEHNLYLLARQLNVSNQEAAEIQARLYPNPNITVELNAIDPENSQIFHVGSTGQKGLAIEQLIILGGKRRAAIAFARENSQIARLELEELLRNLKLRVHTSLYSVYFGELTLRKYDTQMQLLDTLIRSYEVQTRLGNVALKEVVRLKAEMLQLNNDRSEIAEDIEAQQKNLRLLLRTDEYCSLSIDTNDFRRFEKLPSHDSLQEIASHRRADLQQALLITSSAQLNLKYQRSLAVPDLLVGANYDQQGGAFRNQVNLTLGMPLPLWNRNQGNIRAARVQFQVADISRQIQVSEVHAEVRQAWANMQRSILEFQKLTQLHNEDFLTVFNGMAQNFRRRNISIIEFVDFFESYHKSLAEINRIRKQLALAAETINYVTNAPIYQ